MDTISAKDGKSDKGDKSVVSALAAQVSCNNLNDKHNQAVNHGSVELALDEKFITVESLLEWLSTPHKNPQHVHELAYNAVCKRRHPDTHYLKDGVHILAKSSKLAAIALTYGLKPSIKDRKEGESSELWNYIYEDLVNLKMNSNLKQRCILLHKGTGTVKYLRENLVTLYGAGFRPEIPGIDNDIVNDALLRVDRTDKLRSSGTLAGQLLTRVSYLQQHAPNYYAEVAYKHYHKVAIRLYKEKLLTNLNQEALRLFDSFFQNIIDRRLLSYDKLCYNIAIMTPDIAGYVLGFPIHTFIPNEEQIHQAIAILQVKGKDEYCAHIKKLTEPCGLPVGPFTDTKFSLANEQDVFGEDIANYVPFDIVAFRDTDHVYRFTRMEFKQLLDSKKNPYTNMWLPSSILRVIKSRVSTVRDLGLPMARTLKEHLDCLEQGQFFSPSTPAPTAPSGAVPAPRTVIPIPAMSRPRSDPNGHGWRPPVFDHNGDIADTEDDEDDDEDEDEDEVLARNNIIVPIPVTGNIFTDLMRMQGLYGTGDEETDDQELDGEPILLSPIREYSTDSNYLPNPPNPTTNPATMTERINNIMNVIHRIATRGNVNPGEAVRMSTNEISRDDHSPSSDID